LYCIYTGVTPAGEGSSSAASSSSELKFKCDWPSCTKSFIHQDYLQVHYRRHTDEKPYRCHHCDATYRQKSGLKYHLDKVHNEKTVGRSGRKRKVSLDTEVSEATRNTKKVDKCAADTKEAEALCGSAGDDERGGHFRKVSDECHDCHPTTVGDSIRQKLRENVTAMQKSKEGLLAKLQMGLQTKHSGRDDKARVGFNENISWPSDVGEDIKWPSKDMCTADDREEDVGNMGLDDDWMLDDDVDGKDEELRFSRHGLSQRSESGDRDQVGSTSDTEPLDEDLCEELRKLTDVINGADLSPRGIESRPTTYGSPDAVESFVDTADGSMPLIEAVPSNPAAHQAQYQNELLHCETDLADIRQTYEKFPSAHMFSNVNAMQCGLYARCQSEEDMEDLNAESESSPDDLVTQGRPVVLPIGYGQNVTNADLVAGEYYSGGENKALNCFANRRMQYSSPLDASAPCPASRLRSATSNDGSIDTSIRPSDIDMPGQSWTVTNPYWPVRAADSMSSMSGHSSLSNPVAPVCSSVGPEYVEHLCQQEESYINSEAHWSSADGDHRWSLHNELVRGWCDSSQPPVNNHPSLEPPAEQTLIDYSNEPNVHWHMGRQGESAFTPSRMISSNASAMGFDVVGRQTSPSVGPQYCVNNIDMCPVPGRVADSLTMRHPDGYMSSAPDSSWSGFYGRPGSSSSCVDGVYDQYLSRDTVYKSSLPSERLYIPPPSQMGVIGGGLSARSSVDYSHSMAMARQPGGAYGLGSNGYALTQMHTTSPWSESEYGDDIECRRPLSDVGSHHHRMPYQQNSMLYNVVPRYY
jgi:Zinc finger, C2H2 type